MKKRTVSNRNAGTILLVSLLVAGCNGDRRDMLGVDVQVAKPCSETNAAGQLKKCEPVVEPLPDHHLPPLANMQMTSPLRVDRTPAGWLLVTDSRENMVLRIDAETLRPVEGFRTRGKPLGVAALGTSIYVGNADRGTIDVHRTNGGGFMASFGPGAVSRPADIEADVESELLFVLDGGRREVRIFTIWGTRVGTISGPGAGDDQLQNPTALGIDPVRQWVLVSDYGSADTGPASLKVFTYDGELVQTISGAGNCGMLGCSGGFSRPQGVAVDALGLIYLPDALLAQVLVYDPATWTLVGTIGDRNLLRLPTDVVFDQFGDLFIVSNGGAEIDVVRGVGTP